MPKAMFWIGFLYVIFATVIAFWIGRPIIRLSFATSSSTRRSAMRWSGCATPPRRWRSTAARSPNALQFRQRFSPIVSNYKRYINRMMGFNGWNLSISQIIVPLPWLMQAPRLFAGQIKFGDITQTASAFSSIQDGLSFFRNSYD